MKKQLTSGLLLAGLLLSLAGCGGQSTAPAEPERERNIDVYLDSYDCGLLRVTEDGTEQEYGSIGLLGAEGDTIGDLLSESGFSDLTPVSEEDEFEGWLEFTVTVSIDENGFDTFTYELVSEELYSTEQLLAREVADHAVDYVVKWAGVPVEDYFAATDESWDSVTTSGSFSFSANGGRMRFFEQESVDQEGWEYESPFYTYWLAEGEALNDHMGVDFASLVGIEKDGAEFAGWTLYEADSAWWNSESVEDGEISSFLYDETEEDTRYLLLENAGIIRENATTEELCGLSAEEGKTYFALANWN